MFEGLAEVFKEESLEILSELESSLLELNDNPDDQELIGRVFRSLHTIKGSGGMAGFSDISAFAHEVETVFEEVRSGNLAVSSGLINLVLAARDQIKRMVDAHCGAEAAESAESERIIVALRQLANGAVVEEMATPAEEGESQTEPGSGGMVTYRIRFHLAPDIFCRGVNPLYLLRELDALGNCRAIAQPHEVPTLERFDPERCYLFWDVILSTDQGRNAIEDVFIFVADECRLQIDVIDAEWSGEENYKRVGEILVERGDLSRDDLTGALAEHRHLGELLVERALVPPGVVEAALIEQTQVQQQRESRKQVEFASSIRVKSDKLDILVNLIGEMVTVQARLSQLAQREQTAALLAISEEVERLTWELRDQVLTIRMLPIGATFSKFRRLVHDLSHELGKSVQLETDGAETELDKTVIERLNDPLVHLIRNCIDHGIESPEERQRKGKPASGTVHLSASHAGANVVLKVRDDGAGLDRAAIRRKAEGLGLLAPGAEIADRELFALILAPGFSTARQVTEVSGRGVGMDVVRQAVDALRGDLDITSTPGEGTIFSIKLPLTLAIIDGLLVKVGEEDFVLPLGVVVECIEYTRADARRMGGRDIVSVRDEIVPFVRLRDQFAIVGDSPAIEQVVIADFDGERIGFLVDYVIGEHQTVIKNLGRIYKGVRGISGATILGDGKVALILDLADLAVTARQREERLLGH